MAVGVVASLTVCIATLTAAETKYIQTNKDTRLYREPGFSSGVVGQVPNGSVFDVIGFVSPWFQVRLSEDVSAYLNKMDAQRYPGPFPVSASVFRRFSPEANAGIINQKMIQVRENNTAIYERNSNVSAVVASASQGSVFEVIGYIPPYYQLRLKNKKAGWIHRDEADKYAGELPVKDDLWMNYLDFKPGFSQTATPTPSVLLATSAAQTESIRKFVRILVDMAELLVQPDSWSQVKARAAKNAVFEQKGASEGFYQLLLPNDDTAWIHMSQTEPYSGPMPTTDENWMKMAADAPPSLEIPKSKQLAVDSFVSVQKNAQAVVSTNASVLSERSVSYVEIIVPAIRIKAEPIDNSADICKTFQSSVFKKMDESGDYYCIQLGKDLSGWVLKRASRVFQSDKTPDSELYQRFVPINPNKYIMVIIPTADIKNSPDQLGDIIAYAREGTYFEQRGIKNNYYQIVIGKSLGWINANAVTTHYSIKPPRFEQIGNVTYATQIPYLIIVSDKAMIYPDGSDSDLPIGIAAKNSLFQSLGVSENFYHIALGGMNSGWISTSEAIKYTGDYPPSANRIAQFQDLTIPSEKSRDYRLEEESYAKSKGVRPGSDYKKYPDVLMDGFYELKMSKRDYSYTQGNKTAEEMRRMIENDPVYQKLPRDVLISKDFKTDMTYKINMEGKLADNISAYLDVAQEPDFPMEVDVRLKIDDHELTFGKTDAQFDNGEFLHVNRALSGVKYSGKNKDSDWMVAQGKERSTPKKFESPGLGLANYKVGNKSLLEGSVSVYLDNVKQSDGSDYTVDYAEGEIRFTRNIPQTSYIKVIYEFTNPIEDFLPTLSRKTFLGGQYRYTQQPGTKVVLSSIRYSQEFRIPDSTLTASANGAAREVRPSQNLAVIRSETVPPSDQILIPDSEKSVSPSSNQKTAEVVSPVVSEFQLSFAPILLSSESVTINSRMLRPNRDYFLRHKTGKLIIKSGLLNPGDLLQISYSAYKSSAATENIKLSTSKGPYYFKRQNVLPESVQVVVDGLKLSETRDYILDSDTGKLYFNMDMSGQTELQLKYSYLETKTVSVDVKENPLEMGFSYLTEFSIPQDQTIQTSVPNESVTITSNIFFLKNRPVTSISDVIIKDVSGNAVATTNYVIDTYTGKVTWNATVPAGGTRLSIQYAYRVAKYWEQQFVADGVHGDISNPYDTLNYSLDKLPIKFRGVRSISITEPGKTEISLTSQEYGIDYLENDTYKGHRFKFWFIGGGPNALTTTLPSGTRISVKYDFTPVVAADQGSLVRSMIGGHVRSKITDNWLLGLDFANTSHNLSRPTERVDSYNLDQSCKSGTAENPVYLLPDAQKPLVENSEEVFINNQRQTKDKDYYIVYETGQIRFLNKILTALDAVKVNFEYYKPGNTETGQYQQGKALKLVSEYRDGNLTVLNDYKVIDDTFMPLGDIAEARGSSVMGGSVSWALNSRENMAMDYHHRETYTKIKDISGLNKNYIYEDTLRADAHLVLLDDQWDTVHSVQAARRVQPNPDFNAENKNVLDAWSLGYSGRGVNASKVLKNGVEFRTSYTKDQVALNKQLLFGSKVETVWTPESVPIIKSFDLNPKAEWGYTKTDDPKNKQFSTVFSSDYRILSNIVPIEDWKTVLDWNLHKEDTTPSTNVASSAMKTTKALTNISALNSYVPFRWLNLGYDYRRTEEDSPLLNQSGKREESKTYKINQLQVYNALTTVEWPLQEWVLLPVKNTTVTYLSLDTTRFEAFSPDTQQYLKRIDNTSQKWGWTHLTVWDGIEMDNGTTETSLLKYRSEVDHASQDNRRDYLSYSWKVAPKIPILDWFDYSFNYSNLNNELLAITNSHLPTSSVRTTRTPERTQTQHLGFSPPFFWLPIPFTSISIPIMSFNMAIDDDYKLKTDEVIAWNVPSSPSLNRVLKEFSQDNSILRTTKAGIKFSPMRIVDFGIDLLNEVKDLSRNKISTAETVHYESILHIPFSLVSTPAEFMKNLRVDNFALTASTKPLNLISLDGAWKRTGYRQWTGPTVNMTLEALKAGYSAYLMGREQTRTVKLGWSPISMVTLNGGYEWLDGLQDRAGVTHNVLSDVYNQKSIIAGVSIQPIANMSFGYDYIMKRIDFNGSGLPDGYSGTFRASYKPNLIKDVSVDFQFSMSSNWGTGLNDLDRSTAQQATNATTATTARERKDTVYLGSLMMNINVPMDIKNVERFVISGEGYIKKQRDEIVGHESNNFDISGMVFKARLEF